MSTIANLIARKERLMEQLRSDPGPNEREKIETMLSKIDTALALLEPRVAGGADDQ